VKVIGAAGAILELGFELLARDKPAASRAWIAVTESAPSLWWKRRGQQSSGDGLQDLPSQALVGHR
jgi:hypothetical protein